MTSKQSQSLPKPDSTQSEVVTFDSFIYRIPVFPLNFLSENTALTDQATLADNPLLKESIFLASPELIQEVERLKKSSGDDNLKLRLSILKYFIRMSSRCTPFGLFAGCGLGTIGEKDDIVISSVDKHKSYTRLDMNYLCSLIHEISSIPEIQKQLKYFPNTSLYESGLHYRYVEYKYDENRRKHILSCIERDPYLDSILQNAADGALIEELAQLLVSDEITLDEAYEYLRELIVNQVVVSEMEPTVTGEDLLTNTIKIMQRLTGTDQILPPLKQAAELIHHIDKQPIGRPLTLYHAVEKALENLNHPVNRKFLFQSNLLIKNDRATISRNTVNEILDGICVLNKLTPKYENQNLKTFREEFYKRYENEEIPMVHVLDVETGIGFGDKGNQSGDIDPLLDGIPTGNLLRKETSVSISPIVDFIHRKYEQFLSSPISNEIELSEEELSEFRADWSDLPPTFNAIVKIINRNAHHQLHIYSAGGSTAANLLGRFCHMSDDIETLVRDITKKEEEFEAEKILAEIVHLPESRTGNILQRPTLRRFEIPYLAKHSVKKNHTIPVSDLLVSITGNRIILRSKSLNKEILPRLTTAHNFHADGLPIYQFLCSLQAQNLRPFLGFRWGPILEKKAYLPRVTYKNIIIYPASWFISSKDTIHLPKITDKTFFSAIERFRKEKNIPRHVVLVEHDNKLLIDFDDLLSVQLLFDEVKNRSFQLEEYLDSCCDEALVKRQSASFANEIVFCFARSKPNPYNQ